MSASTARVDTWSLVWSSGLVMFGANFACLNMRFPFIAGHLRPLATWTIPDVALSVLAQMRSGAKKAKHRPTDLPVVAWQECLVSHRQSDADQRSYLQAKISEMPSR